MGTYNMSACATLPGRAEPICANETFGRNASSWADMPWAQHDEPTLAADK